MDQSTTRPVCAFQGCERLAAPRRKTDSRRSPWLTKCEAHAGSSRLYSLNRPSCNYPGCSTQAALRAVPRRGKRGIWSPRCEAHAESSLFKADVPPRQVCSVRGCEQLVSPRPVRQGRRYWRKRCDEHASREASVCMEQGCDAEATRQGRCLKHYTTLRSCLVCDASIMTRQGKYVACSSTCAYALRWARRSVQRCKVCATVLDRRKRSTLCANHREGRNLRLVQSPYHHTYSDWTRLQRRYRGLCAYCGAAPGVTKDHVVPIIRGGHDGISNILPACIPCNTSKSYRLVIEWRLGLRVPRPSYFPVQRPA